MRMLRALGLTIVLLVLALLISLAIPLREWRTGELPAPPLSLVQGGPAVSVPKRIWIDADPACGHGRTADPDDCLAILLLAQAHEVQIAGISTVHGNAPIEFTDRRARDLVAALSWHGSVPGVYRGSASAMRDDGSVAPAPAHIAIQQALQDGPLTLIGLGPLTNVAAALKNRPDLQENVTRLVAVMGRRPGHLFHPAEGAGDGMLFGHGPVFRDFNFDQDRVAAALVLSMALPTTFIPYEGARSVVLDEVDLSRLHAHGGGAAWVAARSWDWLEFWKERIGRSGFFPFDLLAGAYVLEPRLFDCAKAMAWVSKDQKFRRWRWFYNPDALLVGLDQEMTPDRHVSGAVLYCPQVNAGLHEWMMFRLAGPRPNASRGATFCGPMGMPTRSRRVAGMRQNRVVSQTDAFET
jgi:purine nucleosidase